MPESQHLPAISALRGLLGDRLSTGESVLALHARDEAHTTPAMPDAVVFPQTTAEVAEIVRICAAHGCPVVPFGIGTSLEGHVVPIYCGVSVDPSPSHIELVAHSPTPSRQSTAAFLNGLA